MKIGKKLITNHAGQCVSFQDEPGTNVRIEKYCKGEPSKVVYVPREALLQFAAEVLRGQWADRILEADYTDILAGVGR